MAIDRLQTKIRKMKNPSMLAFSYDLSLVPPQYLEGQPDGFAAYAQYAGAILNVLRQTVPAVRFDFASFALQGTGGLALLNRLMESAQEMEYYLLLDAPAVYSKQGAVLTADALLQNWKFDGLVLNCYIGSDGVKPFVDALADSDKDLFLVLRTANKSASEMQDLLTGTRLVYTVAADMAKRLGADLICRNGYSRIAGIGPATSPEALQSLRSKYPAMFLLIDGYDYSGANAKNCSVAFDKLGHGAIACARDSVLGAWKEEPGGPIELAMQAADRMKKNLMRYIAIL